MGPKDDPSSTPRAARRAHVRAVTASLAAFHTPLSAEAAALGFRGWHSRGHLPHFDMPGTVQAVTFRLADSLPAHVVARLAAMEESPVKRKRREDWLDRGRGACWLRRPEIARLVEDALLHFDGERYRLSAWCVMPNHVHVLFEVGTTPLGEIMKSWKGYSAREANRFLGRQGAFWEEEYWDRYMRDERHFRETVRYVENNPVKARLTKTPDPREWPWSSARRRDAFGRLPSERGAAAGDQEAADKNVRAPRTDREGGHSCPPDPFKDCLDEAARRIDADMGSRTNLAFPGARDAIAEGPAR